MKRAAIYVRVSSEEQKKHGLSVDNQLLALQDYCKASKYVIAGIYNDAGISARKKYTKRPALLQLIEDCQSKKIDIILFTKLDRWFRSVKDYYEVMAQIPDNVTWRAIWEDYETETSSGIFKVNIMLSVAQAEADRTSERIKATNDYKRQRGDYLGTAPLGYKVVNCKLVIDEEKKPIIETLFKTYLSTLSTAECQRAVLKEHNTRIPYKSIQKITKNPVYTGTAKNGFKCDAYITEEQYNYLLDHRQTVKVSRVSNGINLFSGILFCEHCNRRLEAHNFFRILANGNQKYYYSYHCKNSVGASLHKYLCVSQAKLETYLLENLEDIYNLENRKIQSLNNKSLDMKKNLAYKQKLEGKLKRLAILFEDGDIEEIDYKEKRNALKKEIAELKIQPIPILKPLPIGWRDIYDNLDNQHKRAFWLSVINKISFDCNDVYNPKICFK